MREKLFIETRHGPRNSITGKTVYFVQSLSLALIPRSDGTRTIEGVAKNQMPKRWLVIRKRGLNKKRQSIRGLFPRDEDLLALLDDSDAAMRHQRQSARYTRIYLLGTLEQSEAETERGKKPNKSRIGGYE